MLFDVLFHLSSFSVRFFFTYFFKYASQNIAQWTVKTHIIYVLNLIDFFPFLCFPFFFSFHSSENAVFSRLMLISWIVPKFFVSYSTFSFICCFFLIAITATITYMKYEHQSIVCASICYACIRLYLKHTPQYKIG